MNKLKSLTLAAIFMVSAGAQAHEVSWYQTHLPYHCGADSECYTKAQRCDKSAWIGEDEVRTRLKGFKAHYTYFLNPMTKRDCMSFWQ